LRGAGLDAPEIRVGRPQAALDGLFRFDGVTSHGSPVPSEAPSIEDNEDEMSELYGEGWQKKETKQ
jgi:hypothetical protein